MYFGQNIIDPADTPNGTTLAFSRISYQNIIVSTIFMWYKFLKQKVFWTNLRKNKQVWLDVRQN